MAGRYRLLEELGRGAAGVVYRAEHLVLGHQVAVKVLLSADQEAISRFQREAQALSKVRHPNVCTASDFGPTEQGFFLVIEYLEGRDLAAILDREGRLSPERAVRLFTQLLSALGACHRAGVVHRDLKPANVLIIREPDGSETLKLVDFGIVGYQGEAARQTKKLTAIGLTLGTPHYMSPEQACADQTLDGRSDLYQVGIMLFEALTGAVPFDDDDLANVLWQQVHVAPARVTDRRPGPGLERFDAIIARLLKKNRDARYPHAQAVIAALTAAPKRIRHPRHRKKPTDRPANSRYLATLRRLRWRRRARHAKAWAAVAGAVVAFGVLTALTVWSLQGTALSNTTSPPAAMASLSGVATTAPTTDAPRLLLQRHVVARAVKRGEAREVAAAFSGKTRKLYCHATFDNPGARRTLYVEWWFGDKRVDRDRLKVRKGAARSAWAATTIRRTQKGQWRCDIVTKAGTLISSRAFRVDDD